MSLRANSLYSVVLDGVYFAALTSLVAGAMSATVRGQDVRTAKTEEVLTDRRLTDDHVDSQLNTDDNMPSGDPTESPAAKREANMLGMKLYEVRTGHIRIDDVAATSPAWDAGVRRGDRLISIDTLRPRSLAPWVKEVGRLLNDTPDGKSVAAAVERDGETLALRIRVPVSKAAEVRDARQEERAIANMAAGNPQQMQQLEQQGAMPMAGSDTGVAVAPYGDGGYGGWGMGGFFDDGGSNSGGNGSDRIATTAVAQLMSVNTFDQGAANRGVTAESTDAQTQNMQTGGGRQVGLAAFQDNGQGVRAAVVVRGLPPGSYQVGIGQGGGMTGGVGSNGFGTGVNGNGQFFNNGAANSVNQATQRGRIGGSREAIEGRSRGTGVELHNQPVAPGGVQPAMPAGPQGVAPSGGAPSGGAAPSGAPAGGGASGAGGASLANPKNMPILAQQLDTGNGGATIPNQNAIQQGGNTFGQGQNQVDSPQNANPNGNNFNNPGFGTANPASGLGGSQFVAEIGVLQVGQDGSGRVETQLEGMQVSNLAGMSVMVVSPLAQNTAAAQGGIGQGGNVGGQFPAGAEGRQPIIGQADRGRNLPTQSIGGGMNGVVATGMIQLVENSSAANSAFNDSTQNQNQPQDTSGSEQLRDRNRTTTPSDFDPRSPRQ